MNEFYLEGSNSEPINEHPSKFRSKRPLSERFINWSIAGLASVDAAFAGHDIINGQSGTHIAVQILVGASVVGMGAYAYGFHRNVTPEMGELLEQRIDKKISQKPVHDTPVKVEYKNSNNQKVIIGESRVNKTVEIFDSWGERVLNAELRYDWQNGTKSWQTVYRRFVNGRREGSLPHKKAKQIFESL